MGLRAMAGELPVHSVSTDMAQVLIGRVVSLLPAIVARVPIILGHTHDQVGAIHLVELAPNTPPDVSRDLSREAALVRVDELEDALVDGPWYVTSRGVASVPFWRGVVRHLRCAHFEWTSSMKRATSSTCPVASSDAPPSSRAAATESCSNPSSMTWSSSSLGSTCSSPRAYLKHSAAP